MLPSLPVPTLEETAERLMTSLEPFCAQSDDPAKSRKELEECVAELAAGKGGAQALQDEVLRRHAAAEAGATTADRTRDVH